MKKFSLLIVITIIITSSCKKTGDSFEFTNQQKITKFLSVRDNHSQLIKRIAKSIEDDNRNKNYLEAIIDKLGNPIWDKIITNKKSNTTALQRTNQEDEIVIVPVAEISSQEVTGFFVSKVTDTTVITNFFSEFNYSSFGFNLPSTIINAEDIALVSMYLENLLFNNSKYIIHDERLFNNGDSTITSPTEIDILSSPTDPINLATIVVEHHHCTGTGECSDGVCDECDLCVSYSYFYISNNTWDTWGGAGLGGLTGGGIFAGVGWSSLPNNIAQTILTQKLSSIKQPNDLFWFDQTINPANAKVYNNVTEFASDLNSFSFESPTIHFQQNNQKIEKQRVYRGLFGGYDFFVKTEKNSQNKYELKDVTSSEFGNTLGWSWTQTTYSTSVLNPRKPNEITIDIYGTENRHIVIESFGTVYKSPRHYQITFDNNTGSIIAAQKIS